MARTARRAIRQIALAGLLGGAACAVMQDPPGGPPDFTPPVLVGVTPDSGSIADSLEDYMVFEFDEVVNEMSGGGIERLVRLSPRTNQLGVQVEIDWRRRFLAVRPSDGWRPNLVYHVEVLPGISDLRNNSLEEGWTVIFSTGGAIPDTRVSGTVLDWERGTVGRGALIEAIMLPDSLTYVTEADSSGAYELTSLPRGTFSISAAIDGNRNRRRERREAFDSFTVNLDGHIDRVFWTFVQDTTPPQMRSADWIDSMTVGLQFSQKLDPGPPPAGAIQVWALPDTTPVAVAATYTTAVYDSLTAVERATRDSLAALADTTATPTDTVAIADTAAAQPGAVAGLPRAVAAVDTAGVQDTIPPSAAQLLLQERPPLSDRWYFRVGAPLTPGGRYLVDATFRNVNGVEGAGRSVLVVPAPADST